MTEQTSIDEEVVLHFRRFSEEKQDQVRALVNYATLMGLTGKDLVSIGGKLDRLNAKRELDRNRNIIEGMKDSLRPVGSDSDCRRRWSYKVGDTRYTFSNAGWYDITIKNNKTGVQKNVAVPSHYEFGRYRFLGSRDLPNVMMNVYNGEIQLP